MSKKVLVTTVVLCALAFVLSGQRPPRAPARRVASTAPQGMLHDAALEQRVRAAFGAAPLRFEENLGQTDSRVKFAARGSNFMLFLTPDQAALSIHTPHVREKRPPQLDPEGATWAEELSAASVVRVEFAGGNPAAKLSGLGAQQGTINYIKGNDPKRWQRNVPHFSRVRYEGIYPGVDAVFYGDRRQMEYDFVVAPGADPSVIRMRVEGAASLELTEDGGLEARTPAGVVSLLPPKLYQQRGGAKQEIAGRYVWRAPGEIGFAVAAYDRSQALVIDPATNVKQTGRHQPRKNQIIVPVVANAPTGGSVALSTLVGGTYDDSIQAIAISATTGYVYVAGFTDSYDFPTQGAPVQGNFAGSAFNSTCSPVPFAYPQTISGSPCGDVFVAEFDVSTLTSPQLVNATYLGGSADDVAWGLALDANDDPYVIGQTDSLDFPTTANALQCVLGPNCPTGGQINYPVTNSGCGTPAQPRGCHHVFFTVLSSNLSSLIYSTYVAGSDDDEGYAVAVDSNGIAYLTGVAGEYFPTGENGSFCECNPFQSGYNGAGDAFVEAIDPSPDGLGGLFATYLGGYETDAGLAIAVDTAVPPNIYVGGVTYSTTDGTFAGTGAITGGIQGTTIDTQTCGPGNVFTCGDGFVVELNYSGSQVNYGTFLGGSGADQVNAILVNQYEGINVIAATGQTQSFDFQPVQSCSAGCGGGSPAGPPYQASNQGGYDAFLVVFATGFEIYGTYLGGSNDDIGLGIASDSLGDIYISGSTASGNQDDFNTFPTVNPLQATSVAGLQGNSTSFVSVFDITGNLVFSTFYGGNSDYYGNYPTDVGNAIALDSNGLIYLAGRTTSFTTPNNSQGLCLINPVPGANNDQNYYTDYNGFLVVINPTTSASPAGSGAAACPSPSLPTTLTFPATQVGTTSGYYCAGCGPFVQTFYDEGSGPLVTNSIATSFSGANPTDFPETDNCSPPTVTNPPGGPGLPGGTSCQILISFMPSTTAAESATLTITNNSICAGGNNPCVITLRGTGQAPPPPPPPVIMLPTLGLVFAPQGQNTMSPAQGVTITNTGGSNLMVTGFTFIGANPGDFAASGCAAAVTPNNTCTIMVTFDPQGTGMRSATLQIASNASNGTQTIGLSGTGLAPPTDTLSTLSVPFTPQAVNTPSAPINVMLTNSGGSALAITSIGLTAGDTADFAILSNACGTSLGAGSTCIVSLTFTPLSINSFSATLQVVDALRTQNVTLTGMGVAGSAGSLTLSAPLYFGAVLEGSTSPAQMVSVTNSGGSQVTIMSVAASGDFGATNGCMTPLNPGQGCTVSVTFTPTATGTRTGTLTIMYNAAGSPQVLSLSGIGATITMAPPPGASSAISVLPGDTANYTVTITGTPGLVVTLDLTCTSAAPYTLCSVSPAEVTLGGPTAPTVVVTLKTNCVSSMLPWRPSGPAPILPAPFAALWVGTAALYALLRRCAPQSRLLSRAAPVLLLLLLVVTWAGCISNPPPAIPGAPTTPLGSYKVMVIANGMNVTQQLVLTVNVI